MPWEAWLCYAVEEERDERWQQSAALMTADVLQIECQWALDGKTMSEP